MMSSNTLPLAIIVPHSAQPKIPFENSKTMDDCRLQVLRKFRKEIVDTVRFSDVSQTLIACGLVSKEECFEICKLRVRQQMSQCFQKVHDIIDILICQKQTEGYRPAWEERPNFAMVKEIWNNFITSLRAEHTGLASKMENELDKCAESKLLLKRANSSTKLKKGDIGPPKHFHHVQHFGLLYRTAPSNHDQSSVNQNRIENKIISVTNPSSQPHLQLNGNDSDLQEFFRRAGVLSRHLSNPVTRQIIYRFIMENGGMDAIRKEVQESSTSTLVADNKPSEIGNNESGEESSTLTMSISSSTSQLHSPPPATVPFEPTPRPVTTQSFYF